MKRRSPHAAVGAPPASGADPRADARPENLPAVVLVSTALLLVALTYATVHMNTLADTWISLAGGRQIVAHGVDDSDPFSFNSRPSARQSLPADASRWQRLRAWAFPTGWINQNWLSHVVLYGVHSLGGDNALLAWKILLYAAVATVLLVSAGARGAPLAVAATAAAGALAASREYLEIRAQDHTNLVATIVMLVLALAARRDRRWLWTLPPIFTVWANLHGGFVFGLATVAVFLAAGALAGRRPDLFRQHPPGTLAGGVAALAASGAAVVVLSPYRLANLTHPIEISVGRDAALWRTVVEWQPLWRGLGAEALPFVGLTAVAALALGSAFRAARRGRVAGPHGAAGRRPAPQVRTLPDLGDAAVVLFALAMAFASRRFVPLASVIAAAPLAQWLGEALTRWRQRTPAAAVAAHWRRVAALVGVAVAAAGAWLGACCVRTYTGPWPVDFTRTSVFDRLTYAHLRPAGVCRFLAANRIAGRTWNFWEEGGYLAWDQTPNTATGRPPVLVFIDGRAQGAYPADVLRSYYLLRAGGPAGEEANARRREMNRAELERARAWVRRQLAASGVWLADIPYAQEDLPISFLLLNTESWRVVYADEEHTLLADTETPDGRALSLGIDSGTTRFPDDFPAALTRLRRAGGTPGGADLGRVVALARSAVALHPSARAVRLVAASAAAAPDRAAVVAFYREVVAEFFANRERHRNENGYAKRLLAVEAALAELAAAARAGGEGAGATNLAAQLVDVSQDAERTLRPVLW